MTAPASAPATRTVRRAVRLAARHVRCANGPGALALQERGEALGACVRALPLAGAARVLDVGCGIGSLTRAIAAAVGPGVRVDGIDRDPAQVRAARRLARAPDAPRVRFRTEDVLERPAAAGRGYDLVLCRYLLMYLIPAGVAERAIRGMAARARAGGTVACVEADVNFGAERYPAPPEPLRSVLSTVVDTYRRTRTVEWRSGLQLFARMRAAGLADVRVAMADPRIIQGGLPAALAAHAACDAEALLAPCVPPADRARLLPGLAAQWREYVARGDTFLYTPVLIGVGRAGPAGAGPAAGA